MWGDQCRGDQLRLFCRPEVNKTYVYLGPPASLKYIKNGAGAGRSNMAGKGQLMIMRFYRKSPGPAERGIACCIAAFGPQNGRVCERYKDGAGIWSNNNDGSRWLLEMV